MVKKSSTLINSKMVAIESLANELSEKPYGEAKPNTNFVRTTISLDSELLMKIEDFAQKNKRDKKELKSVSAIVRQALDDFIMKYEV